MLLTYYEINKEKILLRQKKYRDKNRDKIREKDRDRYKKNKSNIKKYKITIRDKLIIYNKLYYAKNKIKMLHQIKAGRWKQLYDVDINMTDEELINECNKCFDDNIHEFEYFVWREHYNTRRNHTY